MIPRIVGALALVAALGAAACGSSTMPASPSATPVVAASQVGAAAAAAVGVSGVIADLNLWTGTFTLVSRGGSPVIRVDDRTQVWSSGTQIRVSSLLNGLNADVRGTDQGRYVQAASISVRR